MPATLNPTEERLVRLEALVTSLDERLATLERSARAAAATPTTRGETAAPFVVSAPSAPAVDLAGLLTLTGRTFLVLAGAYLLRGISESGTLPTAIGAWLGMAYAAVWLVQADRGARTHWLSSLFHGGAAVLIAMPLLAEAVSRFQVVTPTTAAAVLGLVTLLILLVAWRGQLQALAWIATMGALATAGTLVVRTGDVAAFSVALIALGIATLWLGYECDWFGLRWLTAPAADLAVFGLTLRALAPATGERPATAISIQLLLLAAYLTTVTVRTLVRGRSVIPFEVVQTAAALAVGLGGAVAIARATGAGDQLLGFATLAFAVGCYVVAFLDRQRTRPSNTYFYSSLGLVLMMVGSALVLPTDPTALVWLGLAMAAVWTGPPFARLLLLVHATVFAAAAAVLTSAPGFAVTALFDSGGAPLPQATAMLAALVAALAACCLRRPESDSRAGRYVIAASRLVLAVLLAATLGGLVVVVAAPLIAAGPGETLHPGRLAALRTVVLSASALALAAAGRTARLREFGWLLYPVLAMTAFKLVVEDFSRSGPALLFVALAAYGGALIAAPRLARRTIAAPSPGNS